MGNTSIKSINIRPGVNILSVLKHLNYKPWFALSEFVDNSIQSFLDHEDEIKKTDGEDFKLRVTIEIDTSDEGKIGIRDNAAGIFTEDYARAFRPAAIPPDRSGLSEFGMGMKSAACWFAENFYVRTAALGEEVAREVHFDIDKIIKDSIEELSIKEQKKDKNVHYTTITLLKLHKPLQGRTIQKIKEHLASIYREFFRNGILELEFCGDLLSYDEPTVLNAPYYKDSSSPAVLWRKEINFDFGNGLSVSGFAALREKASVSGAGFSLFRRGRVVEGSVDEGYRPELIFRKSNSYTYQRLFGELHLEGFEISHTKDGFRWEENEETFLELLREHLDADPLKLLDQAEGHRARPRPEELRKAAETATQQTAEVIEREIPRIIETQLITPPDPSSPPNSLNRATQASSKIIDLEIDHKPWRIMLELSIDPAVDDWVEISNKPSWEGNTWKVGIRMSLVHPFMQQFSGSDPERIEALLRVATALVLAEVTAYQSGVKYAGQIRKNVNQYLKEALSKV